MIKNAQSVTRDLLTLARYAGGVLPDDTGKSLIMADDVERIAMDAARMIKILSNAVLTLQQNAGRDI